MEIIRKLTASRPRIADDVHFIPRVTRVSLLCRLFSHNSNGWLPPPLVA